MKYIPLIIITIIAVALFQYFLPWWTLTIPTFVIGFLGTKRKPLPSFWVGFVSVFLLWSFMITWISMQNNFILANRISQLFFQHKWITLLVIINALIGGIVGGVASLSGRYLRDAL